MEAFNDVGATPARSGPDGILAQLLSGDPTTALVKRVCEVSVGLLGVSGAGMCLVGGRQHQVVVHGTDPLIQDLEDLQLSLGEGPCIDAVRTGTAVVIPNLADFRSATWHHFAEHALVLGVQALFAFPLRAGQTPFGALDLYRDSPGPMSAREAEDAATLVKIASQSMLAQRDRLHLDGTLSALNWLTAGDRSGLPGPGRSVDLGPTVGEALLAAAAGEPTDEFRAGPDTR